MLHKRTFGWKERPTEIYSLEIMNIHGKFQVKTDALCLGTSMTAWKRELKDPQQVTTAFPNHPLVTAEKRMDTQLNRWTLNGLTSLWHYCGVRSESSQEAEFHFTVSSE